MAADLEMNNLPSLKFIDIQVEFYIILYVYVPVPIEQVFLMDPAIQLYIF